MIQHKIGDSWSRIGTCDFRKVTDTCQKANLTGWTIASRLTSADESDTLIAVFDCEWTDPDGQVFMHTASSTSTWPEGLAKLDIQFTSPEGKVVSSKTALVEIVADNT